MTWTPAAGDAPASTLAATPTIESDHPAVIAFARKAIEGATSDVEAGVKLFEAVRDGVMYDPYACVVTIEGLRASTTLAARRAWCVPKAILLAAACRAVGIPARLGFADVRNHLSTEKLRQLMGTDVYAWHGTVSMFIGGRWVKATPAFNSRLCERFGLVTTNFDGRSDSLLHPIDREGRQHVEYVADRGEHDDTPVAAIRATFEAEYPRLIEPATRDARRSIRDAFTES